MSEVERLRAKKKQIYEDLKDEIELTVDELKAKREWVGLTWDDVEEIFHTPELGVKLQDVQWIAYMVQAKLREKNT